MSSAATTTLPAGCRPLGSEKVPVALSRRPAVAAAVPDTFRFAFLSSYKTPQIGHLSESRLASDTLAKLNKQLFPESCQSHFRSKRTHGSVRNNYTIKLVAYKFDDVRRCGAEPGKLASYEISPNE